MESKEFFNQFHKKSREFYFSKSLQDFYETNVVQRLPNPCDVLELGSGSYSIFEEEPLEGSVTAIDFSHEAIKKAPRSRISYKESNVVDSTYFTKDSYDLIFDSHCLNCITSPRDRQVAFQNIYFALKPEGIFATELMVQPIGQNVVMPFKMIKTANELEAEIISYGFKINYFMISKENSFGTLVNGVEVTCDVLRVIAKK